MKRCLLSRRGSLTLEAAVVFPFFLALMFLLINFINLGMIYVAMGHAVAETAKEIATHAYPLGFIDKVKMVGGEDKALEVLKDPTAIKSNFPEEFLAALTADIYSMLGNHIKEQGCARLESAAKLIAEKKIREYYPLGELGENSFEIIRATMYNPLDSDQSNGEICGINLCNEDIALVVEYKVKMPVPFFGKEIILSNTAVERAWVDDK